MRVRWLRRIALAFGWTSWMSLGGVAAASPGVVFSTWLGGNGEGQARDVAFDAQGNLYVTGGTSALDFPRTLGPGHQGQHDVFVAKFRPDGTPVWARLIGGPGHDRAYAIRVDGQGVVTVGGRAGPGFPTTPGAFQPGFGGDANPNAAYGPQDGFVARLSADGATLRWATYLGGADRGFLRDIDVASDGRVAVAYTDLSGTVPFVTPGSFGATRPSGEAGVVAVLSADGARVAWGGYLGAPATGVSGYAFGTPSVRFASDGGVVVLSHTSVPMVTTAGAYDRTLGGRSDFHVARIVAGGARLFFGTFLGGSDIEFGDTHNLALAPDGSIVVAGETLSGDFPGTAGRFQPAYAGGGGGFNQLGDGVVARLSADGSRLLGATYLGGRSGDGIEGVAAGSTGEISVSGGTYSADFPTTPGAVKRTTNASDSANPEAFVARLSPDLRTLVYASFYGGSGDDLGLACALNAAGELALVGETASADFPLVRGQPPAKPNGGGHVPVVVRFAAFGGPCAGGADADGDGVPDACDDCPHAPDPGQQDSGGVGFGSGPDGIGDACQCGDVNGDGHVSLSDAILIEEALLVPPAATLVRPGLCDVNGTGPAPLRCSLADLLVLRRALLGPPTATVQQACPDAMP